MRREESATDKVLPVHIDYRISRTYFLRALLLSGAALQLPLLNSCHPDTSEDAFPLNSSQYSTLKALLSVLWPSSGDGPGAELIQAPLHIVSVLNDPEMDETEVQRIMDQLDKFGKECESGYGAPFHTLEADEQHAFTRKVADSWGESWISRLLTLVFEALLLDPLYNVNPDGIGWDWLDHDPGTPRPDERLTYPKILKLV